MPFNSNHVCVFNDTNDTHMILVVKYATSQIYVAILCMNMLKNQLQFDTRPGNKKGEYVAHGFIHITTLLHSCNTLQKT